MKILLAPSETKSSGGVDNPIDKDSFIFKELYDKRMEVVDRYNNLVSTSTKDELKSFFGLKKDSDIKKYSINPLQEPTKKAIQRYTGVAYDAIEYNQLDISTQKYIDENVIIFSNLFGPIRADNLIPDYKYKQGAKLPDINVEKFYKDNFSDTLDEYLGGEVVDLRAGYYEKFYKIKANYLTFKFLKGGKVVSHYAKKYRGILLKEIAKTDAKSHEDILNINFNDLKLKEIQESKNKREIIFEVIE
jgi:cytoplasmic iron level regulating protein YaaA (DUF328/UPF0246 family)